MESEKVKEIKECLDCCKDRDCETCLRLNCSPRQEEDCRLVLLDNALTLINELESENETIKLNMQETEKASFNINQMNGDLIIESQQLKDRIAELECSLSKKTMEYELLKCGKKIGNGIVEVLNEAQKSEIKYEVLRQFAERLKEKFNRQEERFADTLNRYENDLDKVKESDLPTAKYLIGKATGQATMAEKAEYYIDETLKEFIGEER